MPFTARTLRELLYCLTAVAFGLGAICAVFGVPLGSLGTLALVRLAAGPEGVAPVLAGGELVVLVLLLLAPRTARVLGALMRWLAARLLGVAVEAPPPVRRRRFGPVGWVAGGLADAAGWRALAYLLLKLPLAVLAGYAVFAWATGLVDVTYPFWWRLFRNHPPDVHLDPVPVLTPFGSFQVATFPGTVAAFAAGTAMLFAAPWLARLVVAADVALIRTLLGPGRLARRVRDLEETRARAVDDTATLLRRLERDLHDGAQVRLAALALNLGRVKEKLGEPDGEVDLARTRELVDAAHRGAKEALVELRDLARGIHPAVLDNGLPDALATLAATAAVPVRLAVDIPVRPSPAIETIAYFCAAELLANAVKHSRASAVTVEATQADGVLRLCVADNGTGGADSARGTGLAGLRDRAGTVDGRLTVDSPPGGPTRITVVLPLRARA
jgi:signal transduction histidine kinase